TFSLGASIMIEKCSCLMRRTSCPCSRVVGARCTMLVDRARAGSTSSAKTGVRSATRMACTAPRRTEVGPKSQCSIARPSSESVVRVAARYVRAKRATLRRKFLRPGSRPLDSSDNRGSRDAQPQDSERPVQSALLRAGKELPQRRITGVTARKPEHLWRRPRSDDQVDEVNARRHGKTAPASRAAATLAGSSASLNPPALASAPRRQRARGRVMYVQRVRAYTPIVGEHR